MTRDEVVQLMESTKTTGEWQANCASVKAAFGGHYPDFWFAEIIQSGRADRIIKAAGDPNGASIRVVDAIAKP